MKNKIINYIKDVFEVDTLIYIVISIALPWIVMEIANIYPRDNVTGVFMLVVIVMYFTCVILICPILETNRELRMILKESKQSKDYGEVCEKLKQRKYYKLRPFFIEYNKNIKVIKENVNQDAQKKYVACMESSYFFDEDNLINNDLKTRTINQISQSLTGVGIFGTFLGIVKGVSGIDTQSSEAMRSGIATLLSGVKVSFNSSLYGILASVVVILIYKALIDMTMSKVTKLNSKISSLVLLDNEEDEVTSLKEEIRELRKDVQTVSKKNDELITIIKGSNKIGEFQ